MQTGIPNLLLAQQVRPRAQKQRNIDVVQGRGIMILASIRETDNSDGQFIGGNYDWTLLAGQCPRAELCRRMMGEEMRLKHTENIARQFPGT